MSYSKTIGITPVKVTNLSSSKALDIRFCLQSQEGSNSTFQPHVSGVLLVDDDKEGIRSNEVNVEAKELVMELAIYAMPDEFIELAKRSDCGWQKIPCLVRTFHLRLPPVPLA